MGYRNQIYSPACADFFYYYQIYDSKLGSKCALYRACMLTIGRGMYLHYASKTHLNLSFKKL